MQAHPLAVLTCAVLSPIWALLIGPISTASADPCPDVEVVFARGTTEWAQDKGGSADSQLKAEGMACINAIRVQVLGW